MGNYADFLAMVSTEFHKYLMENQVSAKKIPANALVIFQVEGENEFNKWHKETSLRNREVNQSVIYVYLKKWREHSSIEEINMEEVAA
ncbi:MAG: hypothetical protein Q8M71_12605 [Thermodesulfovibrionales bacterium]|nr:hypothetical protein [Thermodesulfovibrionales bacterium]